MSRSGKITCENDEYIELLINDSNYLVNDGSIFTLITKTGKKSISNTWREIGRLNSNGYKHVCYRGIELMVHRIIYRKFVGKLEKDLVINHKDGNKTNNCSSNLELVTQSENCYHRFLTRPGVKSNAKITQEIADKIREDHKSGISYNKLIIKYSLCKSSISYIINRKTWNETIRI